MKATDPYDGSRAGGVNRKYDVQPDRVTNRHREGVAMETKLESSQKAEAVYTMELPEGITVCQQGHTGAAGTYIRINSNGHKNEHYAREAIYKFVQKLWEEFPLV
jgi:hypothetical protein